MACQTAARWRWIAARGAGRTGATYARRTGATYARRAGATYAGRTTRAGVRTATRTGPTPTRTTAAEAVEPTNNANANAREIVRAFIVLTPVKIVSFGHVIVGDIARFFLVPASFHAHIRKVRADPARVEKKIIAWASSTGRLTHERGETSGSLFGVSLHLAPAGRHAPTAGVIWRIHAGW